MGRLMNPFTGAGNGSGEESRSWVPALDVWESDGAVVYAFDLPGIPEDSISIELEEGALTVSAERERKQELTNGRPFGTFSRTIGLPPGIGEDQIKADYRDGAREIRVAKPEQPKPRRIQIGGGEQKTIEGTATKS